MSVRCSRKVRCEHVGVLVRVGRKCGQQGHRSLGGNASWPWRSVYCQRTGVAREGRRLQGGVDFRTEQSRGVAVSVGGRSGLVVKASRVGDSPQEKLSNRDLDSTWTNL